MNIDGIYIHLTLFTMFNRYLEELSSPFQLFFPLVQFLWHIFKRGKFCRVE